MAAAVLAVLTALIDLLFYYDGNVHAGVLIGAALAAAILVIVTPFDASGPAERKRVVVACAAYLVVTGAALLFALVSASGLKAVVTLAALAVAGAALLAWAFKTRNRRRLSGWHNYYNH